MIRQRFPHPAIASRTRCAMLVLLASASCLAAETGPEDADFLVADGVVQAFEERILSVPIREVIREVHVKEGDRIVKDQVLVEFRSGKEALDVERYEQLITKAEFEYKAAQALFEEDVTSEDDALSKKVELNRLKAEKGIAEERLKERTLKAPFDGVVVRILKKSEESVSETDDVIEVMEVDRLLLLFHLEARMLPVIELGQEHAVRFPAMPDLPEMTASVDFIDPAVDPKSGMFRVRLLLDNKEGLIRPGLRVKAEFPRVPRTGD